VFACRAEVIPLLPRAEISIVQRHWGLEGALAVRETLETSEFVRQGA